MKHNFQTVIFDFDYTLADSSKGDSLTDAETAKRAAVPFVAVLSGVTLKYAFRDCEVYRILESLPELPGLIYT